MALDKAIQHGKEKRQPYKGSKSFDTSCRNHGGCDYCKCNRTHKFNKTLLSAQEEIKEQNVNTQEGRIMNTQKFYCDGCEDWVAEESTTVEPTTESFPVKGGERIPVEAKVRKCNVCNEEVADDVLLDEALQSAYAIYDAKHTGVAQR